MFFIIETLVEVGRLIELSIDLFRMDWLTIIHLTGVDRRTCPFYFLLVKLFFCELNGRVAEWLALRTGKRGDSSSIPAKVKHFFGGINDIATYIACRFEWNSIFCN